mmetsp:Transcript_6757/g.10871  ORF Transcript_6757/g.10871 Transcript_6757/m.10871 type:complete len:92 (+) Transcript_6757:117-392(+)
MLAKYLELAVKCDGPMVKSEGRMITMQEVAFKIGALLFFPEISKIASAERAAESLQTAKPLNIDDSSAFSFSYGLWKHGEAENMRRAAVRV